MVHLGSVRISPIFGILLLQWISGSVALSVRPNAQSSYGLIFPRQDDCPEFKVENCPRNKKCSEITCGPGESCVFITPACFQCGGPVCQKVDDEEFNENPLAPPKKDSNAGPIAGGVIGGIAVIGLIAFFWLRNKKTSSRSVYNDQDDVVSEKSEGLGMLKEARASTHTVASIASNFSNIIQIAYVPGVVGRSGPNTPNSTIPPVPPIPAGHRDSTATVTRYPQSPVDEVFFLMPQRASTYTQADNRSSVATTIYGASAIVSPVPATAVRTAKAAVVTVKGSAANSPASTPEIEQSATIPSIGGVPAPRVRRTVVGARSPLSNQEPSSPAFSVGSTFMLNNMIEKQNKNEQSRAEVERLEREVLSSGKSTTTVDETDWAGSDEETMSTNKRKSIQSRFTYLSTEFETGSPFSDRHSMVSVDDMPLPAGSGMPPASIRSNRSTSSRVASPALSQRTLTGKPDSPRDRNSPFDDSHRADR